MAENELAYSPHRQLVRAFEDAPAVIAVHHGPEHRFVFANKRFVAEFEKEYKRLPTMYAAQGYDTAMLMDAGVRGVKGKVENRAALMKAMKTVKARSVRGDYKIGANGYPVQNYYLRVIGKDAQGQIVNKTMGTIFANHADAYGKECKLK